jgi:hypothetical protein
MPRKPLLDTPTVTGAGATVGRPRKAAPTNAKAVIQAAAADGFTQIGIAMLMDCNVECLKRWMDADPELKQAFAFGRETERRTLHNVLYRSATEGTGKDALISAMFLLKARHGYVEGQAVESSNARVQIEIKLPGAQSPAQYAEIINE